MKKAERQRIESFRHIGCIVTGRADYDVHHLTSGGRRLGHLFTIPLCPWSHRGVKDYGCTKEMMVASYGPSLAHGRLAFEQYFGTQERLLEKVNDKLK